VVIVWRIRVKIVRTILCFIVLTVVHNDVHTHEQFM